MVYRGVPSKGCEKCRARKIRCDQAKPSCGQCIKIGHACPGYRSQLDLMFEDQSAQVARKARKGKVTSSKSSPREASAEKTGQPTSGRQKPRREEGESAPLDIVPAGLLVHSLVEDVGVKFFMDNYVGKYAVQRQFDCLPDYWVEHLSTGIRAVGLAGYARATRSSNLMHTARANHVKALGLVNQALQNPATARHDATLAAVMVLGMFEIIMNPSQHAMNTFDKHLAGALQLVKLRGKSQFSTKTGLQLFEQIHLNMIFNCTMTATELPPEILSLVESSPLYLSKHANPYARLFHFTVRWSQVTSWAKRNGDRYCPALLNAAHTLEQDMSAFTAGLPSSWQYTTLAAPHHPDLVWEGTYDLYPTRAAAILWNHVRVLRLRLHRIILGQLLPPQQQQQHEQPANPPDPRIPASVHALSTLVRSICASVPSLAGYAPQLSHPHPHPLSSSTHKTPNPLDLTDDNDQQPPRLISHFLGFYPHPPRPASAPSSPHPHLTPDPTGTPASSPGGPTTTTTSPDLSIPVQRRIQTLWPLLLVSQGRLVGPAQRAWVLARVRDMLGSPDALEAAVGLARGLYLAHARNVRFGEKGRGEVIVHRLRASRWGGVVQG